MMRLIDAFFLASFAFTLLSCQVKPVAQQASLSKPTIVVKKPVTALTTLAFVGDVIIHQRLRLREEKTNEGYQVIWSDIQKYLDHADVTYANLEGPVAPEYGGVSGFPMFNFPEKIIPNLKKSGFDIVSTANNHALDRQARGIRLTIKNLNKYRLGHTGTISTAISADLEKETWWQLTPAKNKKQIAWLACTEMTNGMIDKESQVLYCYKDQEKIKSLVQTLKQKKDIIAIILLPHWGTEEKFEIDDTRKLWAESMLNEGATAVVGSHPHVVQSIESFTTIDQRQTLIAYSLGNFISNQPWVPNKTSMILYLKISENSEVIDVKYLPLWMNRKDSKDGTSQFKLQAVFESDLDKNKIPEEAQVIWKNQIGEERRLKQNTDVENFLKIQL